MKRTAFVLALFVSSVSLFAQQKPAYDPFAQEEPAPLTILLPQEAVARRSPLSLQPQENAETALDGHHRYTSSTVTYAEVGAVPGTNGGSARFYDSGGALKAVISGNGHSYLNSGHSLGIRTASPVAPLSVETSSATSGLAIGQVSGGANDKHLLIGYDTAGNYGSILAIHEGTAMRPLILQSTGGYVGIGVASPEYPLHVQGLAISSGTTAGFAIRDRGNGASDNWISYSLSNVFRIHRQGRGDIFSITDDGSIGIGLNFTANETYKLHVNGAARFEGAVTGTNIQAHYQDVAEWVPSAADLAPGTVVILDTATANQVTASTHAHDTTVAGVVSAQPGIILGEAGVAKEQIATTGRVKVKVDATRHAIRIGDLLVTSDKVGHAMKSEPMMVNGRAFHQPGTIIGKALEPLADGEGEILVLLSLQ